MKNQIAKGLAMLMMTLALAAASAVVANGQSNQGIKVQVPFEFVVGDQTLQAGKYDVRAINADGDMIAIRSYAGANTIQRSSATVRSSRDVAAKLVFHRYGNTYFLAKIWMAGDNQGRELEKTKQERAMEHELNTIAIYHGDRKPVYEIVEVVALAR